MSPALALRVALRAWPWLGRTALSARFRKLGPEEHVRRALALTCASADAVDEETRQLLVQRAEAGCTDDHATFVEAGRSVGLLVARAAEYRRAIASVAAPGMVVHGNLDRLVNPALDQLAELKPAWATALPGVGHSPARASAPAAARGRQHPGEGADPGHNLTVRDPRGDVRPMSPLRQWLLRRSFCLLLGYDGRWPSSRPRAGSGSE